MKEQVPSRLGFALLGLLHQGPMSGYDLRKIFATTALGNYSSSPGAIYPALRRLEGQGFVAGRDDHSHALRPRRLFEPTEAGRRALREWLERDITREEVDRDMETLMLRFAFHSILASEPATRRFLTQFIERIEETVGALEVQAEAFPEAAPIHSRLALQAGIEQYRASLRWARHSLSHFEQEQ